MLPGKCIPSIFPGMPSAAFPPEGHAARWRNQLTICRSKKNSFQKYGNGHNISEGKAFSRTIKSSFPSAPFTVKFALTASRRRACRSETVRRIFPITSSAAQSADGTRIKMVSSSAIPIRLGWVH